MTSTPNQSEEYREPIEQIRDFLIKGVLIEGEQLRQEAASREPFALRTLMSTLVEAPPLDNLLKESLEVRQRLNGMMRFVTNLEEELGHVIDQATLDQIFPTNAPVEDTDGVKGKRSSSAGTWVAYFDYNGAKLDYS